jgi:chromosome segregation ATPase
MDKSKIIFLCLILLLVLVLSNYMTVVEGFKKKSKGKKVDIAGAEKRKQTRIRKRKAVAKQKKVEKKAAKKLASNLPQEIKKLQDQINALKNTPNTSTSVSSTIAADVKKLQDRITALTNSDTKLIADLKKNTADLKKNTADFTTAQTNIKGFETSVKNESRNMTQQINNIKPQLSKVEKAAQQIGSSSGDAIAKISGYSAVVEKSVAANKQVSAEIDEKAKGIGTQIDGVKKYVDQAKQYSDDIDKKLVEFQKSSALILAQMQLAVDNNNAAKLGVTATTAAPQKQGFQNMGISSIDSAYNGNLQLEGFSTESDSAYLNNSDLFALERNVILALKEFNEAYYAYRKCLHDTPTISASRCATELGNLTTKKDAVITTVNAFNTASSLMNAKMASSSTPGPDGKYVDNGKRITQDEFVKRHDEIKNTARTVSALRSELDLKMANLLDKTKGPFPEAKNKYNSENYMTIGWSILATSVLYYVFVEMK